MLDGMLFRSLILIYLFVHCLAFSPQQFFRSRRDTDTRRSTETSHPKPKWNATWTDQLKRDLLATYDKFARPAQHTNTTVVNIDATFHHIELDEFKSIMTVFCWVRMDWYDEKLTWNASDYGNLKILHLADHEVWQPDIFPYNSASGSTIEHYGHTNHLVYENGNVLWVPPTLFHVFCELNLRKWPFDTQKCYLKLGSWTYDGEKVDLQLRSSETEMEPLITNSEWQLTKLEKSKNVKFYACCEEPYVDITFNLTLARISPTYKAIIITPITAIVFMTLSTFWLPPTGSDKLLLGGTTAIVICLFLLYFTQQLPVMAGHTPLIVIFYSSSLYMVTFSIVISVIVINLARNPIGANVPWIVKHTLTGWLGRLLLMENFILQTTSLHHSLSAGCGNEELREHQPVLSEQQDLPEGQALEPAVVKSSRTDWLLFAVALDRIAFILYCVIFAILAMACAV